MELLGCWCHLLPLGYSLVRQTGLKTRFFVIIAKNETVQLVVIFMQYCSSALLQCCLNKHSASIVANNLNQNDFSLNKS